MDAISTIVNYLVIPAVFAAFVFWVNLNRVLHWIIGVVAGLITISIHLLRSPIYQFFMVKGFEGWLFEGIFIASCVIFWLGLIALTIWIGVKKQPRNYRDGLKSVFHPKEENIPLKFTPSLKKVLSPTDWLPEKRKWLPSFAQRWFLSP